MPHPPDPIPEETLKIALAGLLHDLGKFYQRTSEKRKGL